MGANASLASSVITNNGTFDVSAVAGGYHLTTGKTLFGAGSITGPMTVDSGAKITVGGAAGTPISSLNCSGNLTLNGTEVLRLDKGNATNDTISMLSGTLTLNGTLEVHLVNGAVSTGDSFQLFTTGFGSFTVNSVNVTGDSIAPLVWDTSQLSSGILTVGASATPPVLTGPADASGQCSATVTASATGTPPLVYIWKLDGSPYTSGTNLSSITVSTPSSPVPHQISLYVTNAAGFSLTNTANVTVQDTIAPVITALGANPLAVLVNSSFVDPGFTAVDTCGGALTLTTNNTVNTAIPGNYTNTYTATDVAGNSSTNSRTVIVQGSCVWITAGNGAWTNRLNWTNNLVANSTNAVADFSTMSLSGATSVTVDGTNTVGTLLVDDQGPSKYSWTFLYGTGGALWLVATNGSPIISNNVLTSLYPPVQGVQGFTKTGSGTLVMNPASAPITGNVNIESGTLELGPGTGALLNTTNVLGTTNSGSAWTTLRFAQAAAGSSMASGPIIVSSNAPSTSRAFLDGNPLSSGVGNITNSITLQGGRSINFTNTGAQIYNVNGKITGTGDVIVSTPTYGTRIRLNCLTAGGNDFSGNLIITNGGVQVTDSAGPAANRNVIPDMADVIMAANTTMGISASEKFGALVGDATAIFGGNYGSAATFTNIIGANNHDGTFNGKIYLNGDLCKTLLNG